MTPLELNANSTLVQPIVTIIAVLLQIVGDALSSSK
jgi:hypothetical protein